MHPDPADQPLRTRTLFTTTELSLTITPPRLGSVPYLNARPLHWTIHDPVTFLEPNLLSMELAERRLDVGLIPLYSALENHAIYHIVDGVAIGSLNAVYSVVMTHSLPVVRTESIAMDPASRTSNHLVRVLMEKYYRIKPRYVSPDEPADAQVIIGDPAIAYRQSHADERFLDLAESWHSHTGLPFVFAVWAVRRDAHDVKGIARTLRAAAAAGLAERHLIARNRFEYRYLTENLYYQLGPAQKRAMTVFADNLRELGLLAEKPVLSYV